MLKEQDLPNAKEIYKKSKESYGAYEVEVNNIIIGIKETTEKGRFEYVHSSKIPMSFSSMLTRWLNDLGYKVEFRNIDRTKDKDSLGRDIKLVRLFIKWVD